MGFLSDRLSTSILNRYQADSELMDGSAYNGKSKMEVLLGSNIWKDIEGKRVLDFGCGTGEQSIEMAQHGATVVGLDIVESYLTQARQRVNETPNVSFTTKPEGLFDVILSFDAFEHYADPPNVLNQMAQYLKPGGEVIISFGPTWYHPLGGHLFSPFPWAHLLFTERALITWRSQFRDDGATKFSEVKGGLNQMTIKRFERIVKDSPFQIEKLETVPIKKFRRFHNRLTREWLTSNVRCRLKLA